MFGRKANAPNCFVKDTLKVALCERRALEVLLRLDLLCDHDGLLVLDRRHLLLPQRLLCGFIVPQIELCADEDDWYAGRVVVDFWVPLVMQLAGVHDDCGGVGGDGYCPLPLP